MTPARVLIVISGGGSTACHVAEQTRYFALRGIAEVGLVVQTRPNPAAARNLEHHRVSKEHIKVLSPKECESPAAFGRKLIKLAKDFGCTHLALLGCLVIMPKNVVRYFRGRSLNQHPGPVPWFGGPGMHGLAVHKARLDFAHATGRDFYTEAVSHHVIEGIDEGEILAYELVPFPETPGIIDAYALQARSKPAEHRVQVEGLRNLILGAPFSYERAPLVMRGEKRLLEQIKRDAIQWAHDEKKPKKR